MYWKCSNVNRNVTAEENYKHRFRNTLELLEKAAARLLFHCIKEDVDISFWYENHINKAVVFYGNRV